MFPDASYEPAGAVQHLSCPSCLLDFQIPRPAHDFPTAYAALVDMFSNDCGDMMDSSSKMLRRRPSKVESMKTLMPLRLLSPTLPHSDTWPSASQNQRSTFGAMSSMQESSSVKVEVNNPLGLRLSLLPPGRSQRDTPVYSEPGSPLPGRAYYTSDDLCLNCTPPASHCDDAFVSQEYGDSFGVEEHEVEIASQSSHIDASDLRRRSYRTPRSSGLSFQCSGEELYPSEALWLSTPLPNSPKLLAARRRSTLRSPLERNVESWLSDTASEIGEDVLACATVLSATRAHMVEVNSNRLSDGNLPPRISSLAAPSSATLPAGRYSWTSSDDSPPDSPTREWEFDDSRAPCQESKESQWIFPNRRFDLAMNSPPMSPKVFPDPPATSRFSFSVMSAGIETDECTNVASRWTFNSTASGEKSNVDIITDLQDIVYGFPTNVLLPDTPCISEIRLSLCNQTQQSSPNTSYLPHQSNTLERKSVANFSRPRKSNYLTSSQSTPMFQTTTWRSSYISSSSTIQPATALQTPDLSPLSRIFPRSSEYTRSALYAHIIAYIFINSLPSTSNLDTSRRRRDTPYWTASPLPSQTAAVLSHPRTSNSNTYTSESGLQSRIFDLKSNLRKCIFRLMNNMDSSICQANNDGRAEPLLRAVEEVVRSSEKMSFATVAEGHF